MRTFGGYGKSYIVVVSIASRSESEELFEKISQIEHVKKISAEQMKESMKKNEQNIRKVRQNFQQDDQYVSLLIFQYYFGTINNDEILHRNPIGEIVTQMVSSKNL